MTHDNPEAGFVRSMARVCIGLFTCGLVFDALSRGPGWLAGIIVCAVGIPFLLAVLRWLRTPRSLSAVQWVTIMLAGEDARKRLRFARAAQRLARDSEQAA